MRITVFAAGSQGDIRSCTALCRGLQAAGHTVHLAAPAGFAGFAQAHGVPFRGLRGDVERLMASETGRQFMENSGRHPFTSMGGMRTIVAPLVLKMAEDALDACRDAHALICLDVFAAFGQAIAEAHHIRVVNLQPTPLLPTRAFPAAAWPIQHNLGRWHALLSGWAMLWVNWLGYQSSANPFRRRIGLRPKSFGRFVRGLASTPTLGAYSHHVIARPPDWPETLSITGYLFLDVGADWQPPAQLQAFLEAGDPPVTIGFGGMTARDPEKIARLVVAALTEVGKRGVLVAGWGGLQPASLGKDIAVVEGAPRNWLFPRSAVVVHPGSALMTAAGLRAGKPTVVVPYAADQPFWGARVHALGVGPAPVPHRALTVDRLVDAIAVATTDVGIRERAESLGVAIRAEHGVARAVATLERILG